MDTRKEASEKLRLCREACALSQRQVAETLNIERSTYTRYETGDTEPNLITLVRLAAIYNVDPAELLPSLSEENEKPLLRTLRPDSPIYQLSKDERGLIALYRGMSKEEKQLVRQFMANIPKNREK